MNLERLKTIHNGEKVHPTFSVPEMERRVTALRKELAESGVDAVLFTSYHNIYSYSDFLFTSFGRNYALVVTQDTNTTLAAPALAGQPWRRSCADSLGYTDWQRDNYDDAAASALANAGVSTGRPLLDADHLPGLLRAK